MEQLKLNFDAAAAAVDVKVEAEIPAPPAVEAKSPEPQILSVSDVNRAIRATLESNYKLLWIKGEISNFKAHTSGHFYFSLKDSKAQISAIMFRGFNQGLKFRPADGMEVIVRGKITVYEPRGSYQIFCELMEPVGAGALQMAFEQLKRKLELEGLFASTRKRALPSLPRHVAVVTSPTGAAIRDILNILGRRARGLRVTVIPALVQGDGCPASVVKGIQMAERLQDVDVMIVGRGGGSIEDMWGFNDERVARAIAACRIPVISAVGHEIDFTIADFVADLRAPTPSAAAELVCKSMSELQEKIDNLSSRMKRSLISSWTLWRQKLLGASRRLIDPKRRLQDLSVRCDELEQRLENGMARYFERRAQSVNLLRTKLPFPALRLLESKRAKWARLSSVLDSLSPLKVVERGYSITRKGEELVKSAAQVKTGDVLDIRFAKGQVKARVEQVI